jgi:hypothetical protein
MEFMDGALDPVGAILLCLIFAGIIVWWHERKSK